MILTRRRMGSVVIKRERVKRERVRRSKYDPYREEIEEWCRAGIPVKTMAGRLGTDFTWQGLDCYIRSRGLRTKAVVYEARNHCDSCEYCKKYINTNGGNGRICTLSWRTIQKGVICCPTWCERQTEYEENNITNLRIDGIGETGGNSELHTTQTDKV